MNVDSLGDRMKLQERLAVPDRFLPGAPVVARLDGRHFSNFTKGLDRPYDTRFSSIMISATRHLVEETNALMGYTQSDEITLCWQDIVFFDGRVAKLLSNLAAMATLYFYQRCCDLLPAQYVKKNPTFDCRAWTAPTQEEAANAFLWRELDATKNAISMAAHRVYSHNQLHGKHGGEMQEMLFAKGINFNDFPNFFKRGTFVQRRKYLHNFTTDELEALPPMHDARKNPDLVYERTEIVSLDMPPFMRVTNRVDVIFKGADPTTFTVSEAHLHE